MERCLTVCTGSVLALQPLYTRSVEQAKTLYMCSTRAYDPFNLHRKLTFRGTDNKNIESPYLPIKQFIEITRYYFLVKQHLGMLGFERP